jgi:putative membrane protein
MQSENQKPILEISSNIRDHLANERTFLAWIRTSIGIMAFGFVVEKFALFVRQITYFLAKENVALPHQMSHAFQGYSSVFGVFLVALGSVICLLSFIKYKKVEDQIKNNTYTTSILLDAMLTLAMLSVGVSLVIYLFNSL